MISSYILALAPAIKLNINLAMVQSSAACGQEAMIQVYNDFKNFELITKDAYYFNRRVNNLILHKIKLTNDKYQSKLRKFKRDNDSERAIQRMKFLIQHIKSFKILKDFCSNLHTSTHKMYKSVYDDLLKISKY